MKGVRGVIVVFAAFPVFIKIWRGDLGGTRPIYIPRSVFSNVLADVIKM